jgi:hypothetical protein
MSPISRAAVSALRRLRLLMARWKRRCAVPWLVIVGMPLRRRLARSLFRATERVGERIVEQQDVPLIHPLGMTLT